MSYDDYLERILAALTKHGLLLKQDKALPNVVSLMTGESLASSWWSHRKAREIFRLLCELDEHPDVLRVKLVRRKDTFVHRALWPALLAQISVHEAALARQLTAPARALLHRARKAGAPVAGSPALIKEITTHVLLYAIEVHTASGRHEMRLEPWSAWQRRKGVSPLDSPEEAERVLAAACERIGASARDLPWPARLY